MIKKVAFMNGKGGCGKSTSVYHVSGVLAKKKEKVLVVDFDKQGNSTKYLLLNNEEEIEKTMYDVLEGTATLDEIVKKTYFVDWGHRKPDYYGVDVLPADIRFKSEALVGELGANIKEEFDDFIERNGYTWVLVDMPASNKALEGICYSQIINAIICPFSSDLFSIDGYGDLLDSINYARQSNSEIKVLGLYLSRYDKQCGVDRYIKSQLENFDLFIDIQIPMLSDLREAIMFGRPMSFYKRNSKSKMAYEKLVEEMERKMKRERH